MLELIDLDMPQLGYYKFISSWLYKGEEGSFLVDPGPACTIDHLCSELERLGVDRLDWILLTHIHLDHAGGVGHLAERFPGASILCHRKAVQHLADPGRLWEGTLKALGNVAEVYGKMEPVPEERVFSSESVGFGEGIRAIDTPGHAPHHLCFVYRDILFGGELFGVHQPLEEGLYLRPATPPKFMADMFFRSMARAEPETDRRLCFAHYGSCPNGREILDLARRQLQLWIDVIGQYLGEPDYDDIIKDLSERDPLFSLFSRLPPEFAERERFFIRNSIDGILGWLKS